VSFDTPLSSVDDRVRVHLTLDDDGLYRGTLITDETFANGNYYVYACVAKDIHGNRTQIMDKTACFELSGGHSEVNAPVINSVTLDKTKVSVGEMVAITVDVIDESDKRRGKDSANAIYDNKLAVLLGDYVVSMGLKEITATGDVRSVDTISSLIGTLSEGEIIQLDALNLPNLSEDLYFDIITKKTAYLFAASSEMSAYLSGATLEEVEKMRRLGEIIGLCFQIKDDIFDYHKSTEIGKPFGNDLREGKFTLPAIYALTHSDRDWSIYVQDVRSLSATQDQIEEITNYTIANGGIEYAEAKMQELKKQAISLLPAHISNDLREAFIAYLDIIINRKK
jgi:octaprenyl-diphosphate synthase